MTIKELQEKRAALVEEMRTITSAAEMRAEKDLTEDEVKTLNEKRAALKGVDTQLAVAEELEAQDKRAAEQRAKAVGAEGQGKGGTPRIC